MINGTIRTSFFCSIAFVAGFIIHAKIFNGQPQKNPNAFVSEKKEGLNKIYIDSRSSTSQEQLKKKPSSSHHFKKDAQALLSKEGDLLSEVMLNVVVVRWANEDALAAMGFSIRNQKHTLSRMVMEISGKKADRALLNWLANQQNHKQYVLWLKAYFRAYANEDSEKALQLAQNALTGESRDQAIAVIVDAWAERDVASVFKWLDENKKYSNNFSAYQSPLFQTAMNHHIEQNPRQASALIKEMPLSEEKYQFISMLADKMSKETVYDAIDWAETLSAQEERKAMVSIMTNWASGDLPDAALDYLLSRGDLQVDNDVFHSTINTLANNDRTLLIERLSEFPKSAQPDVIKQIAKAITTQGDRFEYEAWFQTLPIGRQQSAASAPAAEANLYSNPAAAFTLAENIINPQQRAEYLKKVAKVWASIDKDQATSAVMSTATLTESQKIALTNEISN